MMLENFRNGYKTGTLCWDNLLIVDGDIYYEIHLDYRYPYIKLEYIHDRRSYNSSYIDYDCKIGQDSIIYPFTVIEKDVIIGKFCHIGPFCHLRPGTRIEDRAIIGNFTEVVRSRIGKETLMKHFSYMGDAAVGRNVNIGCGVVTANFDGKNKLKTVINDSAFIGADTILRAPVKIGRKAVTGAGSVITREVKAGEVVAGVPARPLNKFAQ